MCNEAFILHAHPSFWGVIAAQFGSSHLTKHCWLRDTSLTGWALKLILYTCLNFLISQLTQPSGMQAHRVQSWMSLGSLGQNGVTAMPQGVSAPTLGRRRSLSNRNSAPPEGSQDASPHVVPSPEIVDNPGPPVADPLPGIFDDIQAEVEDMVPGTTLAFAWTISDFQFLVACFQEETQAELQTGPSWLWRIVCSTL